MRSPARASTNRQPARPRRKRTKLQRLPDDRPRQPTQIPEPVRQQRTGPAWNSRGLGIGDWPWPHLRDNVGCPTAPVDNVLLVPRVIGYKVPVEQQGGVGRKLLLLCFPCVVGHGRVELLSSQREVADGMNQSISPISGIAVIGTAWERPFLCFPAHWHEVFNSQVPRHGRIFGLP